MKHKIVSSPADSNQLQINTAENDGELKEDLRSIQEKGKRVWWFSDEPTEQEQKKEDKKS